MELKKIKEMGKIRCLICGYEGNTDEDQYGNYIHYRYGKPICQACEEDHSLFLQCGIIPKRR